MKYNVNYKTRVIGKNDDWMVITDHPTISLNDLNKTASIVDNNLNIIKENESIDKILKFSSISITNEYLLEQNNVLNSIIGFAVGDAFGVPVEFMERDKVKSLNLTTMIKGVHNVEKGSWSDDTSMVIATIDSILNKKGIDYKDIMNNFIKINKYGEFTSLGYAFDVGTTLTKALNKYIKTQDINTCGCNDFMDNGNGSIMRILPISLYVIYKEYSNEEILNIIKKSSSLTHSHEISIMGCYIYTLYLKEIIKSKDKLKAFNYILEQNYSYFSRECTDKYKRLLDEKFLDIKEEKINSTGYIIDTIESIIYSINNSNNYKESIFTAINLGSDTDTIGALTGAVAGIIYGINDIPSNLLIDLVKKDYIIEYSNKYYEFLGGENGK